MASIPKLSHDSGHVATNKLPALQFYPGDWKKDPGVQALDRFSRSVWFDMILLMHESAERGVLLLNGLPYPDEALANALLLDKQILTTTLNKLLEYGVASKRQSDGAIFNRRMVRDQEIRHKRTIAGLQGGNPNLVKQKPTTHVNQIPTPSSSSSSSSSISSSDLNTVNSSHAPRPTKQKSESLKFENLIFPEALEKLECKISAQAWLDHKRLRRESYKTADSVNRLLKHWGKYSPSEFVDAVDYSIRNNYAGLIDPDKRNAGRGPAPPRKGAVAPSGYSETFEANAALLRRTELEEENKK